MTSHYLPGLILAAVLLVVHLVRRHQARISRWLLWAVVAGAVGNFPVLSMIVHFLTGVSL
jgi:lipoprotein signal peptidase